MAFALPPELPIVDWLAELDRIRSWLNREVLTVTATD
jgi:hypothetical protein